MRLAKKIIKKILYIPIDYLTFIADCADFRKYSSSYNIKQKNIEYQALYIVHSIEKGLSIQKNVRPFGLRKVYALMEKMSLINDTENFAYNCGISVLGAYKAHYERNNFTDRKEYAAVSRFLSDKTTDIQCGVSEYLPNSKRIGSFRDLVRSRRSVRDFSSKKIAKSDILYAIDCASNAPSACNRQMVKAYYCSNETEIQMISRLAKGIGGFNVENSKFIVVTYDRCSTMDTSERGQGGINAGLFSMNLVNALHEKQIGSCFIQFANSNRDERAIKSQLSIPASEKIAVLIAIGHYAKKYTAPISARRNLSEVLKEV